MRYKLTHSRSSFEASIKLSGSKSESNRALIIRFLSGKDFSIDNLSDSDDTITLQKCLKSINTINEFDVGHAGTAMRFLTALFSVTEGERILRGSDRMHNRPIKVLVDALKELGAEIEYLENEGYPPLKIKGKSLNGGVVNIRGDVSSQYLSALIMIAPYLRDGLRLNIISEFTSKPYLLMTINMMQYFGVEVNDLGQKLEIKPGIYTSKNYFIESDWSSASYWFEALSFVKDSSINIYGLKFSNSLQPDSAVVDVFNLLGIETQNINGGIRVANTGNRFNPLSEIDFTNFPDIAQTLSCTYVGIQNKLKLTGLYTLRIKETDRIEALKHEINKLGVELISTHNDIELISFNLIDKIAQIKVYNDHRMAMSFAMLVFSLGHIIIEDPEVVSKSYSNFWNDLKNVGVQIEKV